MQISQNSQTVSLFTREWIEIQTNFAISQKATWVSLFTREWIEIKAARNLWDNLVESPSLRGSGLKSLFYNVSAYKYHRLPLYEGVDWNNTKSFKCIMQSHVSLFTREWIEIPSGFAFFWCYYCLPLYEGVDWNTTPTKPRKKKTEVSLFTREWIEM